MNKLADEEKTIAKPGIVNIKQIIAAVIFAALALYVASVVPTIQIAWVSAILILTIYLFAFEIVGVDVAAISIMVILGLTSLLAPFMDWWITNICLMVFHRMLLCRSSQ